MFNKHHSTVTQHVHQIFLVHDYDLKMLLIMQLFIEVINIPRRFFSISERGYGPRKFNSERICLHMTNLAS